MALVWTFYSADSSERFNVPLEAAKMSGLFKSMIEMSENERAVSLPIITQTFDNSNETFTINTEPLFRYVHRYLMLWAGDIPAADYIKVGPVQTGEIHHVLKKQDIAIIEDYLKTYLGDYRGAISDVRRKKIKALGVLLAQVDGVLDIQSFANKIYAYIAVIIWNTSIVDFAEAMNDSDFRAAQEAAVAAWKRDNPTKFATDIHTRDISSVLSPPAVPSIKEPELN